MVKLTKLEQESYLWYLKQTKQYRLKKDEDIEYKKMERRGIQSGSFITFEYKHPKGLGNSVALPFFDAKPVDVILNIRGQYILGINFHLIARPFRKTVLAYIIQLNKQKIRNDKRFELTYRDMYQFIKRNGLELSIRKYIIPRIQKLTYIKLSEVYHIVNLPTEKIIVQDEELSRDDVDRMIMSHSKKVRASKNKRYGR